MQPQEISRADYPGLSAGKLRVLSIFLTVDGEITHPNGGQGMPSVFIRLGGCAVHCQWCDTAYSWSFNRGKDLTAEEILTYVGNLVPYGLGSVKATITGGEPLHQQGLEFDNLISGLLNKLGSSVSIETAGTHDLLELAHEIDTAPLWHNRVSIISDYKLESSGTKIPAHYSVLALNNEQHAIKFVVGSVDDMRAAAALCRLIKNRVRNNRVRLVFSPVHGKLGPKDIFAFLKEENGGDLIRKYGVGINIQAHKYIFGEGIGKLTPSATVKVYREEEHLLGYDWCREVPYGEEPAAT